MSEDDIVSTFMASKECVTTLISFSPALTLYFSGRPCPFYQQGSCLFSDGCNFVHTVSATIISEPFPFNQCLNHPDATPAATPTNLPRVVVDSPSPIPSPCRSPDTSVLLALRLIENPDDAEKEKNAVNRSDDGITDWSEPLVNEKSSIINEIPQEEAYGADDDTDDCIGNWTALSDYNDLSPQSLSEIIDQEVGSLTPLVYDDSAEEEDTVHIPVSSHPESDVQPLPVGVTQSEPVDSSSRASVGLLSPIELSTLHLGPFRLDYNTVTENANSFCSGDADTWNPPNPLLPSPPRSPSISSTFDLLSSPFRTPSSRVMSPYLGAFLLRSPVSPARTISSAMLDEVPSLDLGLGSPSENTPPTSVDDDIDDNSYTVPHRGLDVADVSPPQVEDIGLLEDDHLSDHDSYDHTSTLDSEGGPTAVLVGPDENYVLEQVTAAIRRQSRSSPRHFLHSQDADFVGNDDLDHSSFQSSILVDSSDDEDVSASQPSPKPIEKECDDNQISLDHDSTAILAYLRSPPQPKENDTLTSLYDIYSDIAPSKDVISDSIRNSGLSPPRPPAPTLSNNSTPASSLRERVFTPSPFGNKRSGTVTADSPPSLSSPITSINSPSVGRSSPFSVPDDSHPTGGSSQDESSRKVPFGFRQLFTLVSLVLN